MTLSDDLLRDARIKAAREDRTVSSVLEEGLRLLLRQSEADQRAARAEFSLPTFDGGASPEVDVDDNSAVLDAMDRA